MFRARKQLGKRQTADSGNGFRAKKFRTDQQVPTYDGGEDGETAGSSSKDGDEGAPSVGRFGRRVVRGQTGNVLLDCEIPRYGTPVERKRCRKAGDYIIGHELGTSPGVPQTQYLARKQGTDEYYLLKVLSFDPETEIVDKEALQGKVLLHNEYTLLSMLDDLDGVIHQHGFFSDYAFEERQIENDDETVQLIYTGRIRRRLLLVLDCVHAHEFCERSSAFISLQRYITITKYSELEALQLFYEVVKVVEQLHARNIIHRDLKLNNIVLNRRTKRIVLTNFFLGKQLINDQEMLFDQRGSPAYISPDVLGGKPYKGKPSDIWALGVILYTIIYGKFPFLDTTPTALFRKIREVDYVIPTGFKTSEKTNILIKSMLTLNPDERFTATEVRVQLEQMLRKMRPVKADVDQIVPELPDAPEQPSAASCCPSLNAPSVVERSQTTAGNSDYVPKFASSLIGRVMECVVDPSPQATITSNTTTSAPVSVVALPKYELCTEPFSRVLESNNRRHELFGIDGAAGGGSGAYAKPKTMGTTKKINTTLRFTPSSSSSSSSTSSAAGGLQHYPFPGIAATVRHAGAGGGGGSPNATGTVHRALSPAGGNSGGTSTGGGGQRNRSNPILNVQYPARSPIGAARAVAAAAVAATRSTDASETEMEVDGTAGSHGEAAGTNNHAEGSPAQQPSPIVGRSANSPVGSRVFRAQANTSPATMVQAAGQAAAQSLPPAAHRLFSIMNYISHIRNRLPPRVTFAPLTAESDTTPGNDFNGIITQEIADKIVPYLIVNLRHHQRVMGLFRTTNISAGDSSQRINHLLELLRQLGVRMEARNGQIVVLAEQSRERQQFLSLLLRIAGFNHNYFVPYQQQQQRPASPSSPASLMD